MPNPFDEFDSPSVKSESTVSPKVEAKPKTSVKNKSNPFDQFDTHQEKPAAKKPAKKEEGTSLGGRIVGSVAGVGDMVASVPGMAFGLGGAGANYVDDLLHGKGHKQSSVDAQATYEKYLKRSPLTGAFDKLMNWAGYGKDYDDAAVNKAMQKAGTLMEKGGDWVENHTKGAITKEDTQLLTNAAMLFGGPKALGKVGKIISKGRESVPLKAVEEPLAQSHGTAADNISKYESSGKQAMVEKPITKNAPNPETLKPSVSAMQRPMGKEAGKVDPKMLAGVAAVGGGALAGYKLADQDKLEGAIAGGVAGLAAMALPKFADAVKDNWSKALKPVATTAAVSSGLAYADKDHPIEGALLGLAWGARGLLPKAKVPEINDMSIDELTNLRNGNIAAESRNISNVANGLRTLVKDPLRREAVSMAAEKGNTNGLSPEEVKAVHVWKGFSKSYGDAAKNAGVLKDFVDNYVTHVVEKEGLPQSKVGEVLAALGLEEGQKGAGTSSKSGFAKHRKYATFEELQTAIEGTGLKVKTKDIADIAEIYGRSMSRAIENKKYVDALKSGKTESGNAFIMPREKSPADYVPVNSPQLRDMKVHSDMAPSVKFIMEAKNPHAVTKGLLMASLAAKRLNTSYSLFHAANLANAFIAATGVKFLGVKGEIDAALKVYKEGGLGDSVDSLLRGGLKIEERRPIELDQKALTKVGQLADSIVNKTLGTKINAGEKSLGAAEKIQTQVFDKFTWNYLHTGMKLAVGIREFERLSLKNKDMPKEKVAEQVASFVNDTFGGLDWYRVASEAETTLGRKMSMAALSPRGRTGLQIAMFSPDWTFSTFRALYKALPTLGTDKQPLSRELHRKYVLRTAAIYLTLMNGINMATSGHSILDNKDPTKIEYKDGTTQQIAKHAMEGYEWIIRPRQTALNKLGPVPSEIAEQLMKKEYLSSYVNAPPIKSPMGHLAKKFLPIPISQGGVEGRSTASSAKRAVQSMLGVPMYGMTKEERVATKEKRKRDKRLQELRSTR